MKKTIIGILTLGIISTIIGNNTSALSYSKDIGINFTFNTSLTVSLSSADIVINDLTPGTSSDSNIVDINVGTNNLNGYYLSSTVGNSTDTTPSHNTTNLVHSSNPGTTGSTINDGYTFTSLSTSDNITSLDNLDNNTWGYSYSTDNGSTWSSYSGLPLYTSTGTTLSEKYTPSHDTINFKIAAKASTTQPSGEYTNVINFAITAYPSPMSLADSYAYFNKQQTDGYYTMQDMEPGVCALAEQNSELTVLDIRDHNTYTIAKLADDRCWMTTNLNLEGGTELSHEDTDIPEGYVLPVANGFQANNKLPESSTEGFSDNNIAYLYNSDRNDPSYCAEAPGCHSYYSWTAATAGSGISISADNTDAPYSICPASWHLPNTRTGNDNTSYYRALVIALGGSDVTQTYDSTTSPTGAEFYSKLISSPYNFLYSGSYDQSTFYHVSGGRYWSATSSSAGSVAGSHAYNFNFFTDKLFSARSDNRRNGFALRCLAK